jgi:polyhydroxyalkanoate synthase
MSMATLNPASLLHRAGLFSTIPNAIARTAGAMQLARATVAREPAPVAPSPADVIHVIGAARLLRYRRHAEAPVGVVKAPILLSPSLINRLYVLDLKAGISVVEQFLKAGHPVYGIDWGDPGEAEAGVSFEGFVQRLADFLATACDDASVESMTLLGHCLGGTMAAALAATAPTHIKSLVLLTAPLTFHDKSLLSAWSRAPFVDPKDLTRLVGHVPAWITQPTFQALKPMGQATKALRLWQSLGNPTFLEFFRCLETWINDNVAIPDAFFEDLISELYRKDALNLGTLLFKNGPVILEDIEVPTLTIAASEDHIVPPASAIEPTRRFASVVNRQEVLDGGHIGVVVGSVARRRLWPSLLSWLDEQGSTKATPMTMSATTSAPTAPKAKAKAQASTSN